jgi:ATP-binding cassette, subfamily C (CFTR/MRP), member 1
VLTHHEDLLASLAEAVQVALGSSYMAITTPFFMIAVYFLQRVYLRTLQQQRILDLETRSLVYSQFSETLEGLSTIRALGWQKEAAAVNARRLDDSQKPYYLMYGI